MRTLNLPRVQLIVLLVLSDDPFFFKKNKKSGTFGFAGAMVR